MKYLFIFSSMILMACSDSTADCDCSKLRWERTAEYQGTTNVIVATTDWNGTGLAQTISSNDCGMNGAVMDTGVETTETLPNGNTRKKEFEYRVTCE